MITEENVILPEDFILTEDGEEDSVIREVTEDEVNIVDPEEGTSTGSRTRLLNAREFLFTPSDAESYEIAIAALSSF